MENCSFQNQVLSVMEVLARAAVAEINRRVDDSCALLRLQVSQSRRDIELLRRRCEATEAELRRRSRARARRKAVETLSPLVKLVLDSDRETGCDRQTGCDRETGCDRQTGCDRETGDQPQHQQLADVDPGAEHVQVKEESSEDDACGNDPDDKPTSGVEEPPHFLAPQSIHTHTFVDRYHSGETPANTGPAASEAEGSDTFPEQQLDPNPEESEIAVKEEAPDENAAPLGSGRAVGDPWSGAGGSDSSCAGRQFEQIPAAFSPQGSLNVRDTTRVKRRAGRRRPQPDEGHGALSRVDPGDRGSGPQQSQRQRRDGPAASAARSLASGTRTRAPWMSGVGEKRFSCAYCDKSFVRLSQLNEHQRSHTGEKPFSCALCGRSFTKQCNLVRHAVVHSGEKPYECALCGKCFTQRSSLKSHQKTAH